MRAAAEESKKLQQGHDENSEVNIVTIEPRFAAGCFSRFRLRLLCPPGSNLEKSHAPPKIPTIPPLNC